MSFIFGGGKSVKPSYTGLQTQTASSAVAIPLIWGKNRAAPNIIWQGDFQSHAHSPGGKGAAGGKGGQSYTYSGSFILAHGWGQMTGVGTVYKNQSTTTLSALGMTFFAGATPQAPWGYLTSAHPSEALGYAGIAYSAVANYDLGGSNTIAQHSFELEALRYNTASWTGGGDADMALILQDFLSDPTIGAGFNLSFIDQTTLFSTPAATTTGDNALQTYCRAMGWGFSPVLVNQTAATDTLQRWADLCCTFLVWTGYSLKFIPRSAETISANGVTYLPNFAVAYTLTDADFIGDSSADPVKMDRADPRDCKNIVSITINNRANQYNSLPIPWYDNTLVDDFGPNEDTSIDASDVCIVAMGQQIATMMGQWGDYVRNRFKLKLAHDYMRIEPGDVLEVIDPGFGTLFVMVEEVTENEDDTFDLIVFEWNESVTRSPSINTASASGTNVNTGAVPASVNPPVIFEPPSSLAGAAQIWCAVSGGTAGIADPLWGGCNVWVSTDNTTFVEIGTIDQPARQGLLTASLAAFGGTNPDSTHTLAVSMAESGGTLQSASSGTDAAAGSTLCYVDGEFIGPQTATLSGANAYNLTTLYRGLYGSTAGSHASGTQFARLDSAIFKYSLPADYIGRTLYLKFQSFNVYGGGLQDLSTCTAYTFTPTGAGYGTGSGGVPATPTGFTATASGIQGAALAWSANAANDNVTAYRVYRAPGTGASFGSAALVATVNSLTWTDTGLAAATGYTYFLEAVNAVGASAPTAGVNLTTATTVGNTYRLQGSLTGSFDPTQPIFSIPMDGDEHFPVNLVGSIFKFDGAPATTKQLPIKVNGTQVGYVQITSGGVVTMSMASAYSAANGDVLSFWWPSPSDPGITGIHFLFLGTR